MSADNLDNLIKESLDDLYNWVLKNQYLGWDMYDGLNSPLTNRIKNPYLRILILQINKFSFINIRNILKVQKGIDLKSMTLFAQSYALLYEYSRDEKYLTEMDKAIKFIKENSLKGSYGYHCWASHYFPFVTLGKSTLSMDVPDIIGTSQAIIAFTNAYDVTKNTELKEIALNAADFMVDKLFHDDQDFPFFYYTSNDVGIHITLNASAQAIEALSTILNNEANTKYQSICERVICTLLKTQKENGSWDYSIYRNGSTKRIQLDFHQGYIIDGLLAYLPHSQNKTEIIECLNKAINYYQNIMFHKDGRSYYRYPLFYPTDIHNQTQGIITFSKLNHLDTKHRDFASKIAKWTIKNMRANSGYFYNLKGLIFTNKIPYMRWGQAWVMLALATYLEKGKLK